MAKKVYEDRAEQPVEEEESWDSLLEKLPKGMVVNEGDTINCTIYGYRDADGAFTRILVNQMMFEDDTTTLEKLGLVEFPIEAVFSMPTKKDLDHYRNISAKWDPLARQSLVDMGRLRKELVRHNLKELEIQLPEGAVKLPLKHDGRGRLVASVESKLNKLHPSFLDALAVRFELDGAF